MYYMYHWEAFVIDQMCHTEIYGNADGSDVSSTYQTEGSTKSNKRTSITRTAIGVLQSSITSVVATLTDKNGEIPDSVVMYSSIVCGGCMQ